MVRGSKRLPERDCAPESQQSRGLAYDSMNIDLTTDGRNSFGCSESNHVSFRQGWDNSELLIKETHTKGPPITLPTRKMFDKRGLETVNLTGMGRRRDSGMPSTNNPCPIGIMNRQCHASCPVQGTRTIG
jgi:hypothetical protein